MYITRPHYEILDGLRGVAALLVVWFHLTEYMNPGTMPLFHGYLAVDFFYVLSGFVIGYAYDGRWGKELTLGSFVKRRLIRLQPMVIMGGVIGIMLYYFSDSPMYAHVSETEWWVLLLVGMATCFCIPLTESYNQRSYNEVTSTNAPMWSLFYEYIANLLYALVVRHMKTWMLALLVALFGVMVVDSALALNLFGTLQEHERALSLNFGFVLDSEHCYVAMCRLLYPFFMGVLLSRLMKGKQALFSHGFLTCSVMLAAVLLAPRMCGWDTSLPEGLFNAASVLVFFPLIVALGARSSLTGKRSSAFCKWLGEISFPLYITHYPFIYVFLAWWDRNRDVAMPAFIMVQIFVFITVVLVAWLAYKLYDVPVRRWLQEKLR